MRPAASAWEKDYSDKLLVLGFKKGVAAPTVFFCESKNVRCVVHGDDFTFAGKKSDLMMIAKALQEVYELKVRAVLGDEITDDKEITILNRQLSWIDDGLRYEADEKHVKEILKYFNLDENSKGFDAPSVRESAVEAVEYSEPLDAKGKTEFRGLAARANYLSLDRMDIQYATKEACREMAAPTEKSMAKMKRIARYLLNHPRVIICFRAGDETDDEIIDVFSDSDWAGCKKTRRSTSGGAMLVSGGLVKTWSSTQSIVAQSSGEAEYYALVRAAAEALGLQSILTDLGWRATIRLWVDSSAAKAIASRAGLGRVRHMEVKFLWLQQALKDKKLFVFKVPGQANPADIMTKPHGMKEVKDIMGKIGVEEIVQADSPNIAKGESYLQQSFPIDVKAGIQGNQKDPAIFVPKSKVSWADLLEDELEGDELE
jgi:hypothetical protein